ncbi:MAG TPA: hypothetical protein VHN78_00045, partial [Chloroflexota bacterium]|nr:hypothetical protein [Chloroflexota bacterium]
MHGQQLVAELIEQGVSIAIEGPEGRTLRLLPAAALMADLQQQAIPRYREVVAALQVEQRYQEVVAWLLAHEDPAVVDRLVVLLPQVPRMGRLPLLRYRPTVPRPGACLCCGEPLTEPVPSG